MQKNLKRASAMILSLAMAVQFGLTDSYYINANDEQPVEETKQENDVNKDVEGDVSNDVDQTQDEDQSMDTEGVENKDSSKDTENQENDEQPTIEDESSTENTDVSVEKKINVVDDSADTTKSLGTANVYVGNNYEIVGTSAKYNEWSSSDSSIATVSGSTSTVTAAGVKVGTATITHKYRANYYSEWSVETLTLNVISKSTSGTPVYVYIQFTGEVPDGLSINDHNWYTIGEIYVDGLPQASNSGSNVYNQYKNQIQAALPQISRYFKNAGVDISKVNWTSLKSAAGADYYQPNSNIKAWHLDGTLDFKNVKTYTVTYTDGLGGKVFSDYKKKAIEGDATPSYPYEINREFYVFDGWEPDVAATVTQDVTYTAKWIEQEATIKYVAQEGGTVSLSEESFKLKDVQGTLKLKGSTATPSNGYYFDGWYEGDTKVSSNNKFVPTKKESATYTAHFVKCESLVVNEPSNVQYDSNEHKWIPTVTDASGNELKDGTDYTVCYSTDNFVDVKEISVTIHGIGKYNGEIVKKYQITPAPVTVTAENKTKKYGETDPQLTAKVKGNFNNDKIDYSLSRDAGENVGDYTINVKGEANQGNYSVTYQPATLTITASDKMTLESTLKGDSLTRTYNGEALSSTAKCNIEGATIEYSTNNVDWSTDVPSITDVGELLVYAKATCPNYTDATCQYTLKVTPKAVTVKANDASKVYGQNDPELTAKVKGNFNNDKIDYSLSRDAGENVGDYTINVKGEANQGNYTVTYQPGTFTITASNALTLTANNLKKEYNGEALNGEVTASVTEGTTIKYSVNGTDWTTEVPSITDVDKLIVKAKAENPNYETVYANYTMEVTPKTVTVTANNSGKTYGAKDPTLTATVSGTLNNDTVVYSLSRKSGENVGTYKITAKAKAEQGNYVVTCNPGTFTISKSNDFNLTANLNADNHSKEYDGNALVGGATASVMEGTTISYSLDGGTTWTTEVPSITNVGTLNVVAKAENANYETKEVEYTLEVTPKAVTVTANNASKVYGQNDPELTASVNGAINGDTIVYTLSRVEGEDVGDYTITVTGESNQGNYSVTYQPATLTITASDKMTLESTLKGDSLTRTYNGEALSSTAECNVEGAKIEYSTNNKDWSTVVPSIKDVGQLKVYARAAHPNYVTATCEYTLKVTPAVVTVKADNKTKVYGTTDPELTATVTGIIGDDKISYTLSRSKGESVGDHAINVTGDMTQGNYKVEYAPGTLTITRQSIVPDPENPDSYKGVTVNSPNDKEYNGKDQTWVPEVKDADGKALSSSDYKVSYDKEDRKNVTGTITVTITGTGNYTGTVTRTYQITPRSIKLTSDDGSKVYDGTPLKKPNVTVTGEFVDGEVTNVKAIGSVTEAGKSVKNTIAYSTHSNKGFKESNYKIEKSEGTLTIIPQSIVPDPENPDSYKGVKVNAPKDVEYDGKEHKWSPAVADKEGNALVEGTDYTVEYSTSDFRNVGIIEVIITGIGNYTGTVTRTYEITPKAYTVTTESAKKVYDGTALTAGGKIEGIVSGETVEFTTTGSRTDEGTSKNTYSLKWNGSAIETNYKLEKESIGELTVKSKSIIPDEPNTPDDKKTGITVSDPKDSKYDGQEHREVLTVKDTKTGKDLIANKDYTVVYSDDLVNAGTVTMKVTGLGNYSGSFTKTYKITKRLVTLTSATVSKTYDGQALTNTSITVSGDGFVEGEGASYEVTGTQTSVGNSANAFEYKLNEKTLASNYDITKVVGTLTITAASTPVTPSSPTTPTNPGTTNTSRITGTTRTSQTTPSTPTTTTSEASKDATNKVKKEKTPKEEKVEESATPKAKPESFWALINLICAIVTVLFGLLLLISKRHKSEDDEEDDETKQQTNNDDESKEQEKKRGAFTRVLAVLIAILSVVFFLVTEDLSLRWTWTDQWTIWMVVIGFVQIVVFFVGRKWKNVDDDEDEQAQQA